MNIFSSFSFPKQLVCLCLRTILMWLFNWQYHSDRSKWNLHINSTSSSLFTSRQRSCGKVMLSVVSVCLSGHVTNTHDALNLTFHGPQLWTWDFTVQGPPQYYPLDMEPHFQRLQPCPPQPVLTSGGQDWRPVQLIHLRTPNCYWHLVAKTEMKTFSKLFTWGPMSKPPPH